MKQESLPLEYYATEEEVQRLSNAFYLACNALFKIDAMEYKTDPDKGTCHNTEGWIDYFMTFASNTKRKG